MQYLRQFLKLFFTFLIIMDPIGNIPSFLALTGAYEPDLRQKILKKAILVAGIVLLVFAVFGRFLLLFFGITPGAFYVSGGVLFFTISFEMIQSKPRSRQTPATSIDPQESMMLAVFPLAIPLIAGPGMITTIMLNVAREPFTPYAAAMTLFALVLSLSTQFVALRSGTFLLHFIGTTGMFVLEKIMGLILAGMSVQLIYEGLIKLGIIVAHAPPAAL